jgi:inositol-phosphate transport system ATP-binding protein
MARVEMIDVSKRWGDVIAVDSIDLAIEDGEFVAILGPSGCGKSTTLFLLAGIYAPSGGELRFDGELINEVEAKDRNVGVVFQSYALYPHMNVRKNIMFPLKFQGVPIDEAKKRAEEAARLVHVGELLERMPSEMSGGQQQRVALARALVKQPQLLLLDEPLSNLDATLRLAMRSEIRALHRRLGVTSILVTHDQIEATTMADRVICMRDGRIEQIGTPDDLYKRPASLFVAGFIGAPPINLMPGRLDGDALHIGDASLPSRGTNGASDVTLGVRPEAIRFAATGVDGRISEIEPMGRETLYFVDSALGPLRLLEAGAEIHHAVGEAVTLQFQEVDTILFDRSTEQRIDSAHASLPT